jgi:FdhD protein
LISFVRYQGQKIVIPGGEKPVTDALVLEHPLQIVINGEPLSITMQTPGDERDLVRGLLYSEDIFRDKSVDLQMAFEAGATGVIDRVSLEIPNDILGDGYLNSRQLLSVASCGICGRTEFEGRTGSLERTSSIPFEKIPALFEEMKSGQKLFEATGGCHGAAAFNSSGVLLALREDIGRHNAVDKVIGALIHQKQLKDAVILLVSGRVSYEIVSKCFMAGIPMLAAVSAPSTLAVDFAKELGVQLLAFCRDNRLTVYS